MGAAAACRPLQWYGLSVNAASLHHADGPLLSKWWVKVAVLAFFTFWIAISFYGIGKIKYGQPLSTLVTDGSYVAHYDTVQQVCHACGWEGSMHA